MITNIASPATDAAGVLPTAAGDTADSGVFDAVLTQQSLAMADAVTAAPSLQAGVLEGVDLLPGMLEDSTDDAAEDLIDDGEEPEAGALWFLNGLLSAPKTALAVPVEASPGAHFRNVTPDAGAAPSAAARADTASDLAQALGFGAADADSGDPHFSAPNTQATVTPVIDTTTWNSMTGTAELFAQATRQGNVERAESAALTTHVRDPRWADDLGNRLATMVRTGESSASLQLTPPDLGPLEVNVSVRENQATVHFGATNAETRALLEASIPRLREMLASQGFQLMDSSVSHGFARQTRHEAAGTPRGEAIGESPMPVTQAIHITGLLDLYA